MTLRPALIGLAAALAITSPAFAIPPDLPQLYAAPLPAPSDPDAHHFANGAIMLGNITYKSVPDYRPLQLDLYLPSDKPATQALPLVIWVHGGGYAIGNPRADWTWGDWTQVLARLSARGYAVAGVSYRLKGEARFPAQEEDVRDAIVFLRDHAADWGIDPSRVYIWGLSAGGHLTALTALTNDTAPAAARVQGYVDWFGPTDFTAMAKGSENGTITSLLGCARTCSEETLKGASPVNFVTASAPPGLILHGAADTLVPVSQSQALYERLKAAGADVTFESVPGLGHGFTGAAPEQLEDILQRTFSFFDRLSHK
ncbi:MAG: alpha/beta hydrolase [Asticcacaulis sp.]|uniref:alpha/beta hydrolase fold domain-containing protein n=1 Tax=Asticcacaulis sp. TaxID=1872648 RepID=UPI0039E6B1AA